MISVTAVPPPSSPFRYNHNMNKQLTLCLLVLLWLTACSTPANNDEEIKEIAATAVTSSPTETADPPSLPETAVPASPTETADPPVIPTEPIVIDLDVIPDVDISRHAVPIEEIYFDTFRAVNRAVPLDRADEDLIHSLRDAIPPIYEPLFETAAEADSWLSDSSLVLGYADGDEAYAYAINILNYHEIASHTVNGRPIMATYCPLCRSGVVYDRTIDDQVLLFGNTSALYQSDMVMLDHQTGSYWVQVSGEAVVGTLTDSRLMALPSQTTTWGQWKAQYPHTLSLSRETGHARDYKRDPFLGYREGLSWNGRFAFPVSDDVNDPRLDPGEVVLGVEVAEAKRAYALERLGDAVVNDTIGEVSLVVFSASEGVAGVAYERVVNGRQLTFVLANGTIQDEETGSTWSFSGEAIGGELAGSQLTALPVRSTLWFALVAAYPDIELHS